MPRTRKDVPVEVFPGPSLARQDSWKGTPLEEADPADVAAGVEGLEAAQEVMEALSPGHGTFTTNSDPVGASGEPEAAAGPPAEAPELPLEGPAVAEAQAAVAPAEGAGPSADAMETVAVQGVAALAGLFGPEEPEAALPASSTPAAADGGNAARKELEDAIQRIETHIKVI